MNHICGGYGLNCVPQKGTLEVPTLVPVSATLFGKSTFINYRYPCKKRGRDRHTQRECPVKTDTERSRPCGGRGRGGV